jgi:hypothetical protein
MDIEDQEEVPSAEDRVLCCSQTSTRSSALFNTKIAVISTVLVYSMANLVYIELKGDSCNSLIPFYTGLIGSILTLFIKPPSK